MKAREVTKQYRLNKWASIIRECRSSGKTVDVWCAEHDIKASSYYYWLRRVREAACQALPPNSENSSIIPVDIPIPSKTSDTTARESQTDIVLRFGSITLEISNNASSTLIENTLRALQNVR